MHPQDTRKWKMTAASMAITKQAVTPILMVKDGAAVQEGTGTFFQIGQHELMVTASHVLEGILKQNGKPLLLDSGEQNEQIKPAQLIGRSELCGDPFDIAITLLDPRTTDRLPGRKYLSLSDVDVGTVFPGAFVIGGFPARLGMGVPGNRHLGGCIICTKLFTGSTATFSGVDSNWHILIDRMEEGGCTDSEGNVAALPVSLGGASGSPLFQTYRDGTPFSAWTPGDVRVIGVATGDWREAIMATRWAAVLVCAFQCFPELRADIEAMGINPSRVQIPAAIYG